MMMRKHRSRIAALYTPPLFGPKPPLSVFEPIRPRPLEDLGLGRGVFGVFNPPPPIEFNTFAGPSDSNRLGAVIEHVEIDYNKQDRIKTYLDPINNTVNVGYERFGDDHRQKPIFPLGKLFDDEK